MKALRWFAAVLALVMIAAACGRSDPASSGTTTTTAGSGTASTPVKSADFGTLKDVCQGGSGGPAYDPGVTKNSITVGTVSDPGNTARPGLNQELFDTAEVFTKWCNDRGGINGRKLELNEHDAGLFNDKAAIASACATDFYLVGGGAVFDDAGVDDRLACLLPDVAGYVVTPEARGADLEIQPVPNGLKVQSIGDFRFLGKKFPATTKHVGVLTGALPATITTANQDVEEVKSLGWDVTYSDQYPASGPTSWAPYVQAMKDKGVKGLIWVGEPENLAKLEQAMADANFTLDWVRADANHYDQKLIEVGGPAIKNTYIRSVFYPFEDASKNPATEAYLQAFKDYKPNGKAKAYLGLQAFSSWLLWAQATKECGADLTRKCVYDNLQKIHVWTGGGLHAVQDPGASTPGSCYALLQASPSGFKLVDIGANDGIYNCNKANLYTLTGNYGKGATLADVGKSINDLK